MKYCIKCGKQVNDDAIICPECGCQIGELKQQVINVVANKHRRYGGAATAAKVFCIISCIATGWLLIPLIWTIPLTSVFCGKVDRGEEVGVGLKICLLLFVSLIGGICALCMGEPQEVKY